jgi:hypothetical protein
MSELWPVIHTYTRRQAIEDGVLVELSNAGEAGIPWPTAITAAAREEAIVWEESNRALQDEVGRAWDVMVCTRFALARQPREQLLEHRIPVTVLRVPNTPRATAARALQLVAYVGPGDDGEAVVTVMLPDED